MKNSSELKNTNYEIFIICLSILSLVNFVLIFLPTSPLTDNVLSMVNYIISVIFFLDFLYRLLSTHQKKHYFAKQGGWADLLSSIPSPYTYIFRLYRIIKTFKLLSYLGNKQIIRTFITDRANSALLLVSFLIILVLQFGSIAILQAEITSTESNIESASDAMWWTFVTITTVGYGDQFPTTSVGRIIGFIVMIVGVGLFGVITGFLANTFLVPKKSDKDPYQEKLDQVLQEIQDLKKQLK